MSGRLTFRPRPLDIYKKLPIIRKELSDDDGGRVSRSVPQMPTGMEPEEEVELASMIPEKKTVPSKEAKGEVKEEVVKIIPIPNVRNVQDYDTSYTKTFDRPAAYIRYDQEAIEGAMDRPHIEYDMDSEDEEFLEKLNKDKKKPLSEDKFEFLMDCFENEAARVGGEDGLTLQRAEKLIASYKIGVRQPILGEVYNHWHQRRKQKGDALLTKFKRPPDPNDPSPYVAFRPIPDEKKDRRKHRKNDTKSFLKMKQLRTEMERARTLLETIKARERTKREYLELLRDLFEAQREDIKQRLAAAGDSAIPASPSYTISDYLEYADIDEDEEDEFSRSPSPERRQRKKLKRAREKALKKRGPAQPRRRSIAHRDADMYDSELASVDGGEEPMQLASDSDEFAMPISSEEESATESTTPSSLAQAESVPMLVPASAAASKKPPAILRPTAWPWPHGPVRIPDVVGGFSMSTYSFPKALNGITLVANVPPFRGRGRIGRGGRIIFDRYRYLPQTPSGSADAAAAVAVPTANGSPASVAQDGAAKPANVSSRNAEGVS